jgi:integrase
VYARESDHRPRVSGKADVCYEISYKDARGKKVWEKVGWTSEGYTAAYAARIRAERLRTIRHGDEAIPVQKKKELVMTFQELAETYIDWAEINKKDSLNDKSRYENHIAPILAEKTLRNITPLDLEHLKDELNKKGLSPKTIHLCLGLVRAMFRKAIAWNMFEGRPPTNEVKFPKLNNRRLRFLTHEEAAKLLKELSTRSLQVYDQTLLSLHCGLRFGEIASLTWADIDFTHGIIHIRSPKSGESRQAFMTPQVKSMLMARKSPQIENGSLVFPDRNGQRQKGVSNAFERAVETLGFNQGREDRAHKLVFHTLRHTFASWLAIQGTFPHEIKELMGHKDIKMTERYTHLIPDQKQKAVLKLARIFDKARQKLEMQEERNRDDE